MFLVIDYLFISLFSLDLVYFSMWHGNAYFYYNDIVIQVVLRVLIASTER